MMPTVPLMPVWPYVVRSETTSVIRRGRVLIGYEQDPSLADVLSGTNDGLAGGDWWLHPSTTARAPPRLVPQPMSAIRLDIFDTTRTVADDDSGSTRAGII